ncbi:hypothetical protein SEVIR_9G434350v4 [Setaria viridis]
MKALSTLSQFTGGTTHQSTQILNLSNKTANLTQLSILGFQSISIGTAQLESLHPPNEIGHINRLKSTNLADKPAKPILHRQKRHEVARNPRQRGGGGGGGYLLVGEPSGDAAAAAQRHARYGGRLQRRREVGGGGPVAPPAHASPNSSGEGG